MYREWLIKGLERSGLTQADLARATGIHASVINRIALGRRLLRDYEIVKIARVIGQPPTVSGQSVVIKEALELVPVVAVVQDGVWRDAMTAPVRSTVNEIPAVAESQYSGQRLAVQVAMPGDVEGNVSSQYHLFVPIEKAKRKLRAGDLVFAEIRRDDLVQQTILRVAENAKGQLAFHSTTSPNLKWSAKYVTVIGLVTGTHTAYRV